MCDEDKILVEKLKSANSTEVYDALVKIRKNYVRNWHKMKELQKYSVIELIIPFLEHPKFSSISLSIIADGCLKLDFVNEVIKCNGIDYLIRIMKSFVNDDIQNRACRALGNMAKFQVGFKAIHNMQLVSKVINFLSKTNDGHCQQTAVRTLMILSKSPKAKDTIFKEYGIVCIAKLLHSSDVQLLMCSIKAIANLTEKCSLSCARQLLDEKFFKVLVELCSHSEESVRNHALISLKNLSYLEEVRSNLIKDGAVNLFTKVLSSCKSLEMNKLAALALCQCIDHLHMWSHNGTDRAVGLKALLVVLQNQNYKDIHLQIIKALIPLAYEAKMSGVLLSLDVLQVLIKILEIFIQKHKCKSTIKFPASSEQLWPESKTDIEREVEDFNYEFDISSNIYPKCAIKTDTVITDFKDDNPEKVEDNSPKPACRGDRHLYSFSSITSDYSSSYSPNRICSPVQKFCTSPDFNYDFNYGSPSSGIWSPVSEEKNLSNCISCWSPVVSIDSDSCTQEKDSVWKLGGIDESNIPKSTFASCSDKIEDLGEAAEASIDNCQPSTSKSIPNFSHLFSRENKNNMVEIFDPEFHIPKKKLKTGSMSADSSSDVQSKTSTEQKAANCYTKDILDCKEKTETCEINRIDHCVMLFIWYLSFHLEPNTNSQIAGKFCFSVLIDYLCFIHNYSPKAEKVLTNLIKNRHYFEKLVINGLFSELEDKMTSKYACSHQSNINQTYSHLINTVRQEAESDYGIGTLSHILVASEKVGKLHALFAVSKLVTKKSALYRLLFQANGLSMLGSFLSDSDIITQKRVMVSLCEIYQSLTKDQRSEKCCFLGTCNMKVSSKCTYKESFLNITFSVGSGAKILANRDKICKNSDYFSALLSGHFLESKAEMVSIQGISAQNLATIFHFLHGCCSDICCPYIKCIPFSVLLDLLCDCDKLLLVDIKSYVEDKLCHFLFPNTVSKIYRQSKIYNSPALARKSLLCAMNIDTCDKDTLYICFKELINLESSINFISDVEALIKSLF